MVWPGAPEARAGRGFLKCIQIDLSIVISLYLFTNEPSCPSRQFWFASEPCVGISSGHVTLQAEYEDEFPSLFNSPYDSGEALRHRWIVNLLGDHPWLPPCYCCIGSYFARLKCLAKMHILLEVEARVQDDQVRLLDYLFLLSGSWPGGTQLPKSHPEKRKKASRPFRCFEYKKMKSNPWEHN